MGRPCSEKIAYRSKHTAKKRLAFLRTRRTVSAENRRRLNVYRCRECGMYHIGKHGMTKQRRHPKPELDLVGLATDLRALGYETTDVDAAWERDAGYPERAISATREDDKLNIAFQSVMFFDGGGLIETADPVFDWPAIEAIGRRMREAGILPITAAQPPVHPVIEDTAPVTVEQFDALVALANSTEADERVETLSTPPVNRKVRYEPKGRRRGTGGRGATKRRK